MKYPLNFLVLAPFLKMEKSKEKLEQSITSFEPSLLMRPFQHFFGTMPYKCPLTYTTYFQIRDSLYNQPRKDPTYSLLRVFECPCYPLIPSTTRNKLKPRSTCVFLGYPFNQRGYKCYELSSRKIIIFQHVIF